MMKSEGGQFWAGPRKSILLNFQRQPLNQHMKSGGMMKPDSSRENRRHHRSSTVLVRITSAYDCAQRYVKRTLVWSSTGTSIMAR